MPKYNWDEMGITWIMKKVARRHGPNASDKTYFPEPGPILVVTAENLQKFIAFSPAHLPAIVSHLDGQSFRVAGDRVLRAYFGKGEKLDMPFKMEALKERAYESVVLASRAPSSPTVVTKEVKVFTLPNGEKYSGSDEVEYQQLYMAALVDAGVDASVAGMLAKGQKLQ